MSDRTFGLNKAGRSNFLNPSLVSPNTPTLANPTRSFGLPTNNQIQTATKEPTNLQETEAIGEQSLLSEAIEQRSFGHDISRIALRRPQAKLTVREPGDKYEQEADWMANQVMQMVVPDLFNTPSVEPVQNSLQRQCAVCEQEEEKVQTKLSMQSASNGGFEAGDNIESRLNRSKGGGSPLSDEVRGFMEPRFGADFSQVRVHTGSEAVQMNRELNAQAFTHQQDVYFGAGKSPAKDALTAHELTHVVQQMGGLKTKQVSKQPTVQQKCSICEKEEPEIQRSPNISAVSPTGIQRWSLFDDDEDKTDSESSSSGGILDWAKEKGSAAVDTVTQAGGDVYDWAKEKGGAAVDSVTQAGGDVYDWAKEKGSAALDSVTQAGSDVYDWAKETGEQYVSALLEEKKASLLAQINKAMQKVSGQEFVYLTDGQITTLNGHCAALSEKSQGLINLPGIVALKDSETSTDVSGAKPIAASTVESLLINLQSSVSAPFMSPSLVSSTSDSETVQGSIQRFAPAIPLVAGLSLAVILAIVAIALMIILIIVSAPLIVAKIKEKTDTDTKEEDKTKTKSKKCSDEVVETLNNEMHEFYNKARKCSPQLDTCESATAKVAAGYGALDGRVKLQQKCYSPGDEKYEEHMKKIAETNATLQNCVEVMHEKCGDRK
ncbi:DUF4157 domain-containing protein [Nostoc sp. C117]|uniref:eCIS core domain-containing protein n=1 Tax=Nostoc sp. C117 TaxID=3349875 RepID=UPI00370D7EAF